MANKVDEILEEALRRVGWFAQFSDVTEAAGLRNVLEDLKTAIAEERKIPPHNTAKMFEEILEIHASLDQPDAIPLIRGHVYAALAAKPRACDVMSEKDLAAVVLKGIQASFGEDSKQMLLMRPLIEVIVNSAISAAYDTQLVSSKEGETKCTMH